jgi:hypothetical protein
LISIHLTKRSLTLVRSTRARFKTFLAVDTIGIDRRIVAESSGPGVRTNDQISSEQRTAWLSQRLSRSVVKRTTIDASVEANRSQKAPLRETSTVERRPRRGILKENIVG